MGSENGFWHSAYFALHTDYLTACNQSLLKCDWSTLIGLLLETTSDTKISSLAYILCIHMHEYICTVKASHAHDHSIDGFLGC